MITYIKYNQKELQLSWDKHDKQVREALKLLKPKKKKTLKKKR